MKIEQFAAAEDSGGSSSSLVVTASSSGGKAKMIMNGHCNGNGNNLASLPPKGNKQNGNHEHATNGNHVHVNGRRSDSLTSSCCTTPDREMRARSTDRKTRYLGVIVLWMCPELNMLSLFSFSYLSLVTNDGTFPHRTNPIGDPQTTRRSSRNSLAGSQEYLNQTKKSDFMVRSNPIGLAEPSIKRDGYAVGKDGSFYRSSEHIYADSAARSTARASSATPEGESDWRSRRASTGSTGSMVR